LRVATRVENIDRRHDWASQGIIIPFQKRTAKTAELIEVPFELRCRPTLGGGSVKHQASDEELGFQ